MEVKRLIVGIILVVLIVTSITNVRVFGEQDQEPPVIVIESPLTENGVTYVNASSVLVKGKITDNIAVTEAYILLYLNSSSFPSYGKRLDLPADGTFSEHLLFPEGRGSIEGNVIITASDGAGNKNEKTITIVYLPDFESPVIVINSPVDGSMVNASTIAVTGKVSDNIGVVSLWIGTTKIDVVPDGSFSVNVSLNEGTNIIKIIAYDLVGNKGEKDLTVTYNKIFIINASAGLGGSISPSGTITVNYGDSKTLTITPNSGYKISNVKVDGVSVGAVSSYTFNNITSDHTISATFEREITQTVIILQIGKSFFTVNGASNTLDSPPVIKNGRTLLPIRAIIEALSGSVSWDASSKKVTVSLGSNTIELWIGKNTAKVNGIDKPIDSTNSKVVPEIISSRTMLPLRFVTENLGCDVNWDGPTQTITITYLSTNFKLNSNPNVIKYINPKTYKVTYTLNISFIDEINVDRLDVFTPSPRNWSSQTNAVLLDCVPKTTCVVKYDPLYGNKYIYYDKTSLINNSLSVTQEFQFTCYEISTCFENIKDIYEYDKNSAEFELYTRDEPEIETNYFKDIVKSVIGDEKNPVEICRKIYNFVINYMTYGDIHQPGGAKNVYINKKGDCGGYSTLFVALTRAAGIPARVVVGGWSSSTTDKYNNWHLWAEFYLEKIGWIPVDPTMGASNDKNRSYYFGNLDNNRYIASKGLNIPLGEYNPVLFQTCCWWWWGNWTKFEEPKTLLNLKFEEVKP